MKYSTSEQRVLNPLLVMGNRKGNSHETDGGLLKSRDEHPKNLIPLCFKREVSVKVLNQEPG